MEVTPFRQPPSPTGANLGRWLACRFSVSELGIAFAHQALSCRLQKPLAKRMACNGTKAIEGSVWTLRCWVGYWYARSRLQGSRTCDRRERFLSRKMLEFGGNHNADVAGHATLPAHLAQHEKGMRINRDSLKRVGEYLGVSPNSYYTFPHSGNV